MKIMNMNESRTTRREGRPRCRHPECVELGVRELEAADRHAHAAAMRESEMPVRCRKGARGEEA